MEKVFEPHTTTTEAGGAGTWTSFIDRYLKIDIESIKSTFAMNMIFDS